MRLILVILNNALLSHVNKFSWSYLIYMFIFGLVFQFWLVKELCLSSFLFILLICLLFSYSVSTHHVCPTSNFSLRLHWSHVVSHSPTWHSSLPFLFHHALTSLVQSFFATMLLSCSFDISLCLALR